MAYCVKAVGHTSRYCKSLIKNYMETNYAYTTKAGTLGGTLLILLVKVNFSELVSTAVLAAVGASVSFAVSIGLKQLIKLVRKIRKTARDKNICK
jgi:hypothetical protein